MKSKRKERKYNRIYLHLIEDKIVFIMPWQPLEKEKKKKGK